MKVKETLIGVAIAIIFLMFCVFGTKLIYDEPRYEEYCDYSVIYPPAEYDENFSDSELQEHRKEQQEMYQKCNEEYDLANKEYSKNMFIISLIFGVLIISLGMIFININSISGGLMFGSLMFIIYGTNRYWGYMDDLMRFIILGIALGFLIYVAYWANKRISFNIEKKKKSSNKKVKKK